MKTIYQLTFVLLLAVGCSGSSGQPDTADGADDAVAVDTAVTPDDGADAVADDGRDAAIDVAGGDLAADEGTRTDVALDFGQDADGQTIEVVEDVVMDIPGDSWPLDAAADVASDVAVTEGACVNEADFAIVSGDISSIQATAVSCYMDCSSLPEVESCMADCIATAKGISSPCAMCFASQTTCMAVNCIMQCVGDPQSGECLGCQEENGCTAAFATCSGL